MIKLNHLEKYFFKNKRNEIHVINDINIEFDKSGLVVLLGPSGSGKTTLLNVIGGLDKVNKGEIVFDDKTIEGYDANLWDEIRNEKVGYIFQNYNLLPQLSVFENIAFVLRLLGIKDEEIIERNVTYILKAVGMFKYRKKKATQLSGGQQQRVAIARALVKNPEIVIADEPTGNLDSKNTLEIMKIIKEISKTKLVVLVTHEKEIAKIYGDRIIELKDGQIINDHKNETQINYEHVDENTVYLQDLNLIIDEQSDQFALKLYDETETEAEPISVRLVVKNKTLYIDIDSKYQKVKLLDENSNLILKDEHYKKLEQSDLTETTFDSEYLNLKDVRKQKRILVSLKQIMLLAFQKVISSTRKGKLLLISFVFSGAMVALAMSLSANFFVPNKGLMVYDNNYVITSIDPELSSYTLPTYDEFKAAIGDDSFINLLQSATYSFVDVKTDSTFFDFQSPVDLIENLNNPRFVAGQIATEDNQIMISSALADSFFTSSLFDWNPTFAQSYGIWDYEDLLKEKVLSNGVEYAISGIVKSDLKLIYVSKDTYFDRLTTTQRTAISDSSEIYITFQSLNLTTDDLLFGSLPTDNEGIIVSNSLLEAMGLTHLLTNLTTWPHVHPYIGTIYGVVDNDTSTIYAQNDLLERLVFQSKLSTYSLSLYVHADDTRSVIANINEQTDLIAATEAQYAIAISMMDVSLSFMIPMILIIFATSFLGFYFLMHSTMISRIYEISVYRSLGMKKGELFISYIVESSFLTTITSVLGYFLATYVLIQLSSSPLGYSPFIVSTLTIILGLIIVYLINVFAGMLPVMRLLRKTPSEIASKYDI